MQDFQDPYPPLEEGCIQGNGLSKGRVGPSPLLEQVPAGDCWAPFLIVGMTGHTIRMI
jgi:hypothetical protein